MSDVIRTAVFVLGMHRSGTSLLSGSIAQAGIGIGASAMPAAPDNPKGFWENQKVVDLNERILNQLGLSWSSWQPLPFDWLTSDVLIPLKQEIAQILRNEFEGMNAFCIKDPRLCRLLPVWLQVCTQEKINTTVVLTSRPVNEVAASLQARDGLGLRHAEALWLRYNLEMLQVSDGLPGFHIGYAEVLQNPVTVLNRLSPLVGRELELVDDGFADASLNHHTSLSSAETPFWARSLESSMSRFPEALNAEFEVLVFPLVATLAEQEGQYNRGLVDMSTISANELSSARESQLFEQAQEAKTHALSSLEELETARAYIKDMQRELDIRKASAESLQSELSQKAVQLSESLSYTDALQQSIVEKDVTLSESQAYAESLGEALSESQESAESLREALEIKESEQVVTMTNHEQDIARREKYTQSLIAALDREELELENTRIELGVTQTELGSTQTELGNAQVELEKERQKFILLRRISKFLEGKPPSND
jgi:hypothetical protein